MILLEASALHWWQIVWFHLNAWDQYLLLEINTEWTSPFFDRIFPWWREATTWIPLYFFLVFLIFWNFGIKAWPWVIGLILTVAVTDQVSSGFLKNYFNRPRPCNDPVIGEYVRLLLNRCPSSGSFTSSHATNHFGLACYLFFTMKDYFKRWGYLLFFWAASICYGQLYVGVHYPLDILGGAIVGSVIGISMASLFNRRIGLPDLIIATVNSEKEHTTSTFSEN